MMLCLGWLLVTTLAARATWSAVGPGEACVGTATPDPVLGYVLVCTATAGCASGNCDEVPLPGPGSATQSYCSCDYPSGPPECCFVVLKKNPDGTFSPTSGGACPFGSPCGWGRCSLAVSKSFSGEVKVNSECVPYL
jgi:hypothetical protein